MGHCLLSSSDHGSDFDFASALSMVDMTLGYDVGFSWKELKITSLHHAWVSHVFLYRAWHEGRVSVVVIDFVEHSLSLESPGDVVITDCFFVIGLMIGVTFHVSDITVTDKRLGVGFPQVSFGH